MNLTEEQKEDMRKIIGSWEEEFFLTLFTGQTRMDEAHKKAYQLVMFCRDELGLNK